MIAPPLRRRRARPLTPRQLDVAALLAQGLPNKSIARELGLHIGSVKVHLCAIYQHLGVENRTQAALLLAARGRA